MIYINATLVLIIAVIVAKLTIEYKEMGNSKNARTRVKGSQSN